MEADSTAGFWIIGVIFAVTAVVFAINRFFVHRPIWDWLQLLVVPAVFAAGGLWFNAQQKEREQRIASEHAQDDTLQAYLDGMSELLTDKDQPLHRAQPGDSLSTVARARTLTVLGRLDSTRKRSVLQFLYESGLIYKEDTLLGESDLIESRRNVVSLQQADLGAAFLRWTFLREADLRGAFLREADLRDADLREADLRWAALSGASLFSADLLGANLSGAVLMGDDPHGTPLPRVSDDPMILVTFAAGLKKADLRWADLRWADLTDAYVSEEQLQQAFHLEGATMPNGQKYEDWLKDREARKEDEKDR